MMEKILNKIAAWPKLTCMLAGCISAFAMAPTYVWPVLAVGLGLVIVVMSRITRPFLGAWCIFIFGMGYFTISLWWVVNALMMDIEDYWWAMGFAILGLPLLLSLLWFVAGYLTIRFSRPDSLGRTVLLLSLLMAAEYGRAFNLTGFPWNLFGYTWGNVAPLAQLASIGGAYFVTALTVIWMAMPVMAYMTWKNKRIRNTIIAFTVITFATGFTFGVLRLSNNPTELRKDTAVVIIQPNLTPDEKWEADKTVEHFMRHVDISRQGIASIGTPPPELKTVAIIWPETSLDERLIMSVPDAPKALLGIMQGHPFTTALVSGMWREGDVSATTDENSYYNSIAVVSVQKEKLNLDDMYDKHHLVPFGEFMPLEQTLGLTPLVGFAGFKWGPGPKVLHSPAVPPVAPMICFEAIFPWYGKSPGAEWLVNTSNDGWYGDTPGPYQHLAMTRFRAIEQGKPIARSATTGISAMIDPYGRILQKLDYERRGFLVSNLPYVIRGGTFYNTVGEAVFFSMIILGLAGFWGLYRRKI